MSADADADADAKAAAKSAGQGLATTHDGGRNHTPATARGVTRPWLALPRPALLGDLPMVRWSPAVRWVDDVAGLAVIQRPEVTLAIWARTLPAVLSAHLLALEPQRLPTLRLRVPTTAVAVALAAALGDDPRPGHALLVDELTTLAIAFARLAKLAVIEVRLDAVRDGMCRKFHTDRIALRLLSTLRGPGSEWVPDTAVRRERLGLHGENADIVPDPTLVQRLPPMAVAILKGDLAAPGRSIVHRSPPLQHGESRLLLTVQPPTAN